MRLSQKGFSLVELMLSVAIMGGVSYAFMHQQETSSKNQAKLDFMINVNRIANDIKKHLNRPAVCDLNVMDKKRNDHPDFLYGLKVHDYKNQTPEAMFVKNTNFPGTNVFISDIVFTTDESGGDIIRVSFEAGRIAPDGTSVRQHSHINRINRDYPIYVEMKNDGSGEFSKCANELSNQNQKSCEALGGQWSSPPDKCDMSGIFPQCVMSVDSCGANYVQEGAAIKISTLKFGRHKCTWDLEALGFIDYAENSCTCDWIGHTPCECKPDGDVFWNSMEYKTCVEPDPARIYLSIIKCCKKTM